MGDIVDITPESPQVECCRLLAETAEAIGEHDHVEEILIVCVSPEGEVSYDHSEGICDASLLLIAWQVMMSIGAGDEP